MLDNYIILAYLLLLLASGIYNKSNNSYKAYTSMGKLKNNSFLLLATIFASAVGGGTTFGLTEAVYENNLAYVYALLLNVPIDILIAIFIVPKLFEYRGAITIGDIVKKNYGTSGSIIAGLSVIVSSIGYMAAQISVSSKIFQYILPLNNLQAILASYFLLIVYTSIGGFRSVVFANAIQFIAMIIAIPVLGCLGLYSVGITNLIAAIPEEKYNIFTSANLLQDTITATTAFLFIGLYPTLIQRILSAEDSNATTKAIINKSGIYIFFIICITINGLIGNYLADQFNDDQHLVINMVTYLVPQGLRGFIFIGFLAATMSTADSDLSITGITFIRDIISKIFVIKNQKTMLIATQCITAVAGLFAIYLALKFNNILNLIILAGAFWSPVILVPMVAGFYKIKIKIWQFVFCSIFSLVCTLINEITNQPIYNFKGIFIGTLISFACFSSFVIWNKYIKKVIL
jgi:Na+/proline symporter